MYGRQHSEAIGPLKILAEILKFQSRLEEAEAACGEALAITRQVRGDEHLEVANTLSELGDLLQAKGDYIFFLDADGSTSIHEIDSFIPKFSPGIDIYIATRTIKHKAPQKRKFFGYGYIFLANLLLGLRVVYNLRF